MRYPMVQIHGMLPLSRANGPGERFVIWTQGCSKGCVGCFNPETWSDKGGYLWSPTRLADQVIGQGTDGLTVTGGDPLEQPEAMLLFLKALHDDKGILPADRLPNGIILYTGFTIDEINRDPLLAECVSYVDLLIDGRFVKELRQSVSMAGSSNQGFHFSSLEGRGIARVSPEEVCNFVDQTIELHTASNETDNIITVTGHPDINRQYLREMGVKVLSDGDECLDELL